MVQRDELLAWLDGLLEPERFSDFCPNGLQVSGRAQVTRVLTAVSASQALFDQAVARGAELVLVHHGLLWKSDWPVRVRGAFKRRLATLLAHGITLVAYHLPLDAHQELGNNAQAAAGLGLLEVEPFGIYKGQPIGVAGRLPQPLAPEPFVAAVTELYGKRPLWLPGSRDPIEQVGIISGGAAGEYGQAIEAGLDAFVTGEPSEPAMHLAREEGVHFLACGHYQSERLGVKALGERLAEHFGLPVEFVELPNPV